MIIYKFLINKKYRKLFKKSIKFLKNWVGLK